MSGTFSREEKLNIHANREGIHRQLVAAHGRTRAFDAPVCRLQEVRLESGPLSGAGPLPPRREKATGPVRNDEATHAVAQQSRPAQQLPEGCSCTCVAVRFVRTVRFVPTILSRRASSPAAVQKEVESQ